MILRARALGKPIHTSLPYHGTFNNITHLAILWFIAFEDLTEDLPEYIAEVLVQVEQCYRQHLSLQYWDFLRSLEVYVYLDD